MQLQISGTIPINVGEMTELNKLYVSLPLPSTRTALRVCLSLTLLSAHTHTHTSCRYLYINQLSGTIPDAIDRLTKLDTLCVSRLLSPSCQPAC